MKNNDFIKLYGLDKGIDSVGVYIQYGRISGKVMGMDYIAKSKLILLLEEIKNPSLIYSIDKTLSEFRRKYSEYPSYYPSDYYFYNWAIEYLKSSDKNFIIDFLNNKMEEHFARLKCYIAVNGII